MGSGTPAMGKGAGRIVHIKCRRCGRRAYHVRDHRCGACGFGEQKTMRRYNWRTKTLQRQRVC